MFVIQIKLSSYRVVCDSVEEYRKVCFSEGRVRPSIFMEQQVNYGKAKLGVKLILEQEYE